jgi:hypothetical protein
MDARLPSAFLVAAMIRRMQDAGGFAAVLARGDESGGAILVAAVEQGRTRLLERGPGPEGRAVLVDVTPTGAEPRDVDDYWRRRRSHDPDLWVVELDGAEAERFVAETLLPN